MIMHQINCNKASMVSVAVGPGALVAVEPRMGVDGGGVQLRVFEWAAILK